MNDINDRIDENRRQLARCRALLHEAKGRRAAGLKNQIQALLRQQVELSRELRERGR